jgi:hypothetical protein
VRIGMIGAGHIGGTLARLLAAAGHEVGVSNSRDPITLRNLVEELGSNAHAGTPAEVADLAEVLVVSVPFGRYQLVPINESAGKVVIDTNNARNATAASRTWTPATRLPLSFYRPISVRPAASKPSIPSTGAFWQTRPCRIARSTAWRYPSRGTIPTPRGSCRS